MLRQPHGAVPGQNESSSPHTAHPHPRAGAQPEMAPDRVDRPELGPHTLVGVLLLLRLIGARTGRERGTEQASPAASARPWLNLPGPRSQDWPQGGSPGPADVKGEAFSLGVPGQR